MSGRRLFPVLLGGLILLVALLGYLQFVHLAGFPDGHRTELDQARGRAFPVFLALSLAIAGFSFFLGWSEPAESAAKRLMLPVWLFGFLVVAAVILNYYFSLTLDHGGGG